MIDCVMKWNLMNFILVWLVPFITIFENGYGLVLKKCMTLIVYLLMSTDEYDCMISFVLNYVKSASLLFSLWYLNNFTFNVIWMCTSNCVWLYFKMISTYYSRLVHCIVVYVVMFIVCIQWLYLMWGEC